MSLGKNHLHGRDDETEHSADVLKGGMEDTWALRSQRSERSRVLLERVSLETPQGFQPVS